MSELGLWAIRCPVSLHYGYPGSTGAENRVAELQMADVLVEVSSTGGDGYQFSVSLAERVRWRVRARSEIQADWWAAHLPHGIVATAPFPKASARGGALTGAWITLDPNPVDVSATRLGA